MQPINNPPVNTPFPPHTRNPSMTQSTVTHPAHPGVVEFTPYPQTASSDLHTCSSRVKAFISFIGSFFSRETFPTTYPEILIEGEATGNTPTANASLVAMPIGTTIPENTHQDIPQARRPASLTPQARDPNSPIQEAELITYLRQGGISVRPLARTTPPALHPLNLTNNQISDLTPFADLSGLVASDSISTAISTPDSTSTSGDNPPIMPNQQ